MVASFWDIAKSYSIIFFDSYGVLKTAEEVLPGTPDLLKRLSDAGKQYYIITNDASRSPQEMAEFYRHPTHGELVSTDRIVTSGTLCCEYLRTKVREGEVAYLGKQSSAHYIQAAGLTPVPIGECNADQPVEALVLLDDEGFDWFADINRAINLVRRRNIPVIVGNSDLTYPVTENDIAVAVGSLANMMESIMGTTFIHFGKPDTMMFSYTWDMALARNPALRKRDVLMVGDTLHTDIIGANKFGVDTVLVLSGNTLPDQADVLIKSTGIRPTHICDSVLS